MRVSLTDLDDITLQSIHLESFTNIFVFFIYKGLQIEDVRGESSSSLSSVKISILSVSLLTFIIFGVESTG